MKVARCPNRTSINTNKDPGLPTDNREPQAEQGGHVQTPTQQNILQGVPGLQGTQPETRSEQGGQNDPTILDYHCEPQSEQGGHVQAPTQHHSTAGSPKPSCAKPEPQAEQGGQTTTT